MARTLINDWQDITIKPTDTFETALNVINQGGYQICLVCSTDGKLGGVVTDSDIRKALIREIKLSQQVTSVMNVAPLIVTPELGENEAHQLMIVNHYFHLPIINSQGILVGLHVAEQLQSKACRNEALVIMAGGRGKRLMPLTDNCPKPMLPIRGKPILEHVIERAKSDGFQNIILSVNYLAEQIINHFEDGKKFNLSITYIHEKEPLGTAGGLSLLEDNIRTNPIVVTNGDILTDVSYSDVLSPIYNDYCDGVMAVRLQEWQNPFGVILSKDTKLIDLEEKPIHRYQVNAGIYALNPSLLKLLVPGEYCDMTDLFLKGIKSNLDLRVFPLHETWLDIGRLSDYEQAIGQQ